jgi:hypothetical protein
MGCIEKALHDNNRKFRHIPFANKGIDAINISNILNRKEVVKEIPPYFKNQSVPIVSYSYTNSIAKGRHVTYNTRQSVLRRKRIYASFVKSKIPKIFEVVYR